MCSFLLERNWKLHLLIHLYVCSWATSVRLVVSEQNSNPYFFSVLRINRTGPKCTGFLSILHCFCGSGINWYSFHKSQVCCTVSLQSKCLCVPYLVFFFSCVFLFSLTLDHCLMHYWKSDMGSIYKLLFDSLVDWSLLSLNKTILC